MARMGLKEKSQSSEAKTVIDNESIIDEDVLDEPPPEKKLTAEQALSLLDSHAMDKTIVD